MPGFRVGQPEKHGRKWRVRVHGPDGRCRAPGFDTREEAEAFARETRGQIDADAAFKRAAELQRQADEALAHALAIQGRAITVGQAVEKFDLALTDRGLRAVSIRGKLYKVRGLCGSIFDSPMAAVSAQQAQELYRARTAQASVATHRAELKIVREFWRWAGSQGWAPINPWLDVQPVGRPSQGKEQLRTSEAQKLHETLLRALAGDDVEMAQRALGAGIALYLGFRAAEVLRLQVRDVTEDGSYVELLTAKTRAGERAVMVPDFLAAPLAAARTRAEEREGSRARILPFRRGWVRDQAHRFCDMAGVPRVCAHALRGMHGSLSREGGATAEAVAKALGHRSTSVTLKHYVTPEADRSAKVRSMLSVLDGGKKR